MERIKIKDLKNHLKIIKHDTFYSCIFTFLVPSADNPIILIPLQFNYMYKQGLDKKRFIDHCIYQISNEMLKVHHLFNVEKRFEVDYFGNHIKGYTFYNANEIWDPDTPTPYKPSHIVQKETFKKIVYEYLGR